MKIASSAGLSFFIRPSYLENTDIALIDESCICSGLRAEDMMQAASCYLAEAAAMAYLGRSEYSRKQLFVKLLKKDFLPDCIGKALERLEQKGSLDDRRFAEAWLRNRLIHRCEGRVRLVAELMERGVASAIAQKCTEELFSLYPEDALLVKAMEKCIRQGKSSEQIVRSLARRGFSVSDILKKVKQNNSPC